MFLAVLPFLLVSPVWATPSINSTRRLPAVSPLATAIAIMLFMAGLGIIAWRWGVNRQSRADRSL